MSGAVNIVLCRCEKSQVISDDVRERVMSALTDAGVGFESVDDLCGLATRGSEVLGRWAQTDDLKIVACFPRAVKWLFAMGGAALDDGKAEVLNMRTGDADDIVAALVNERARSNGGAGIEHVSDDGWVPWFPVIDRDRCVNCKQCLNFCLFGVYRLSDDGNVEVAKPANCKTNCPACGRVCPEAAIIFPKYGQSPINGDEVNEDTLKAKNADLNSMLDGEDIHSLLRRRSEKKKRFSADKPQPVSMMDKLDIPPEVLAGLSAGEIAKISKRARGSDCPNREFCNDDCEKNQAHPENG